METCSGAANTSQMLRNRSTMQSQCSFSFHNPPNRQEGVREPPNHSVAVPQVQSLQSTSYPREEARHSYVTHECDCAAQSSVEALQQALKSQVLWSLTVLREISKTFCELNLELETVDSWEAEIEGVDATLIPFTLHPALPVLVSSQGLNHILMKCVMASGPTRGSILQVQALELLKFILKYAEKYHLVQNARVYTEIGRWMERLSHRNHDEQVK